ncbi:MAG: hypothetical protein RR273_05225, partial [Oscillospiraceae bacterium]
MKWNIASECTAFVIICVVFFYARNKNVLPTLRKFLFKICFIVSIFTVSLNILTAAVLMNQSVFSLRTCEIINMIYYLTTPISGISFLIYSFSVLTKDAKKVFRMSLVGIIPTILYQLVVLTNPITHLVFDVVPGVGYVRGPWIMLAFIIPYYYCIVAFIFSNMRCFDISKTERLTLAAFPVAAFIAIGIQQLFRSIILSGSATACVLIIIYLTIE